MTRSNPATGIPCPVCGAEVGDWCYTYGSLHHPGRTSLALVLTTHPPEVDPVNMIRDASGVPDRPFWDCVAVIEKRFPGGIRRWLGAVGLIHDHKAPYGLMTGTPVWFGRDNSMEEHND
jgi:hypothetical protein